MRLWRAPNRAGVPGADASEVINEGLVNSNIGKGALFWQPDNQATTSVNTVEWIAVAYDDLGFIKPDVGPSNFGTEIVIPNLDQPINTVRFMGQCEQDSGGSLQYMTVRLRKNDAHLSPRVQQAGQTGDLSTFRYQHWTSYVIPVVAGDVFTLQQFVNTGGARFLQNQTWWAVLVNS